VLSIFFGGGDYIYVQILTGVLLVAIVIYVALKKYDVPSDEPQRRKRKKRKNKKKRAKKERENLLDIDKVKRFSGKKDDKKNKAIG